MSTDEKQEAVRPDVKDRYKDIVAAEGDRHEFEHAGFQCALLRHPRSGHWCGYVIVERDSPLYGKEYSADLPFLQQALDARLQQPLSETDGLGLMLSCLTGCVEATLEVVVTVHGGITFSDNPWWTERNHELWAFGFDCAHYGDIQPYMSPFGDFMEDPNAYYRDRGYVEQECRSMADQLRKITDAARAARAALRAANPEAFEGTESEGE